MKKILLTVNVLLLMTMVSVLFGAERSTAQFIFATTASKSVSHPVADISVGINMHLSSSKTVPVGITDGKIISWIPSGETWFSADITTTAPADQQYQLKFYLINDTGDVPITSANHVNLASGVINKVKVVFQYPQVEFNLVKPPASYAGGIGITLHHADWSQSLGSKNDSYIDWIPVADYWFTADETIQKEGLKFKFTNNGKEITQNNPITFKSAQQYTVNIEFVKLQPQVSLTCANTNAFDLSFSLRENINPSIFTNDKAKNYQLKQTNIYYYSCSTTKLKNIYSFGINSETGGDLALGIYNSYFKNNEFFNTLKQMGKTSIKYNIYVLFFGSCQPIFIYNIFNNGTLTFTISTVSELKSLDSKFYSLLIGNNFLTNYKKYPAHYSSLNLNGFNTWNMMCTASAWGFYSEGNQIIGICQLNEKTISLKATTVTEEDGTLKTNIEFY